MLEHLFGSRTRVKLLSLFLRHPDQSLFVREITRLIGTQINAVRRELANLVRLGLLEEVVVKKGDERTQGLKRKYYQIHPKFPLLTELSSLVLRSQILLERKLDKEILQMGDVYYLAFLGSFLGTTPAPVDLFIIGEINKKTLNKLMAASEQELGFEINFSLMTPEEYIYRKDITDKFLYAILEAPKNIVVDRLHELSARILSPKV
ncbi:MAG: winged helix-turn-helix domain-containing protein [Candidatus Uhrbacteria bacterium]|nr:winged helix-turn-helix domain-containing protein [Candidatus Uhrbacteria bacterium]MDP3793344.1 winged helix-turn-helix domain-containing protein [Candidatus Uhrbacteria bacterium]